VLRWAIAAILAASTYFFGVFERVTTQFMSYDAFINMMNSAAFAGDAVSQSRAAFIAAAGPALLLLVAIGLRPHWRPRRFGPVLAAGPWLGAALLTGILFVRGGDGARGLPDAFTPIAYFTLAEYEDIAGSLGPRQAVRLPLAGPPPRRNVVLIVDESIAGKYLDINSPAGVQTPLSRAWPGLTIHNFGIAASIATCSYSSNVTLRYGGTRAGYQRINATMPSIWAYAHQAGLETVYIDAQRTDGALQNQMDGKERAQVDRFIQFSNVPVLQRDMAVAAELIRQLADPTPKFIMVNKMGAHFPVQDKYPASYIRYQPVAARGHFVGVGDTGSREGFDGTPEAWRRYRNAYRNTLLWNVGTFFDRVLGKADLSHTTLIYTSDHGQDLHERGQPGLYTHCSADPAPQEGAVPLIVIAGANQPGADWNSVSGGERSHYQIFPTLLELMGYRHDAVSATYGPSLADPAHDPGTFNALFNARLNRKPVWIKVVPDKLPTPPRSDYQAGPTEK
jgi:lipid A ethanolaminephosphotransferase